MISKVFITGKTFSQVCQYVCQDQERAEVLAVKGVRSYDYRLMADDFAMQHSFLPEKEKPVFHAALSFPPGEEVSDEKLVRLSKEYLKEIGMKHTQYAVVKHTDKGHLHVHIVANRVNDDGKIIGQGLIVERGIKAAEELTRKYELQEESGKHLELINMDRLPEGDARRYRLYTTIKEEMEHAESLADLEKRLLDRDVRMRFRLDPWTNRRQGVSFRSEGYSFAGKRVDESFSLGRLEQFFRERQQVEKLDKVWMAAEELAEYERLKQGQAIRQEKGAREGQEEIQHEVQRMRIRF